MAGHISLLLALLLLHSRTASCGHQSSHSALYDPYHLNDDRPKVQQAEELMAVSNAATLKAYRTYYLILVRNLTRVLQGLNQHSLLDSDNRLSLSLETWAVDSDALKQLKTAFVVEGSEPSISELQDANSLLLSLFGKLKLPQVGSSGGYARRSWPFHLLPPDIADYLAPLSAIILASVCAVWFVLRRVRVWQLVVFVFFLSWACNWARLYHTALAQRQHAVATLKCWSPDEPFGFWESLSIWISAQTSVTPVKDDCLRKLEALAVSPIWDASPLEAAADLMANVLLKRFVQFAGAINLGYRSLIEGLPIWHSVFITLLVLMLPALLMLLTYGYRLRLGFGLLHLGPEIAAVPVANAAPLLPPPPPPPALQQPLPALQHPRPSLGADGDVSNRGSSGSMRKRSQSECCVLRNDNL